MELEGSKEKQLPSRQLGERLRLAYAPSGWPLGGRPKGPVFILPESKHWQEPGARLGAWPLRTERDQHALENAVPQTDTRWLSSTMAQKTQSQTSGGAVEVKQADLFN